MLVPIQVAIQQPISRALLPDLKDASLHGAWLNWQTAQDNLGTDYSAAGDDMTAFGAPTSERVGADFDGAADYLNRAEADWRSGDSQGTVSTWIKRDAIGANHVIFASAAKVNDLYLIALWVTSTNKLSMLQRNNDATDQVNGPTTINAGEWYHVVVVSDGTQYILYVNGQLEAPLTIITGVNIGDWLAETLNREVVSIGALDRLTPGSYFNGEIRDVRYYSEVKTADWVKHKYQAGVPDGTLLLHVLDGSYDLSRYERALVRAGGVVTGHDMEFDGVDDVIDCGDLGNVQTIMGWVKPGTTTEEIWLVDAGNDIMVSGGTVTYTGLTPVVTYVNGVAGTTMAAGVWQHLACVIATVDANNFELGTDGANFGATSQRDVKVFSGAKAAAFIRAYYARTRGFY